MSVMSIQCFCWTNSLNGTPTWKDIAYTNRCCQQVCIYLCTQRVPSTDWLKNKMQTNKQWMKEKAEGDLQTAWLYPVRQVEQPLKMISSLQRTDWVMRYFTPWCGPLTCDSKKKGSTDMTGFIPSTVKTKKKKDMQGTLQTFCRS